MAPWLDPPLAVNNCFTRSKAGANASSAIGTTWHGIPRSPSSDDTARQPPVWDKSPCPPRHGRGRAGAKRERQRQHRLPRAATPRHDPAPQAARDVSVTGAMGEWYPIHIEVLSCALAARGR